MMVSENNKTLMEEFWQFHNLERRDGQLLMAKAIEKSLTERMPAVLEVGTGNGKTFAYLLYGINYIHQHKDAKLVVTTGTITLQNQIFHYDLPKILEFFRAKYGEDFKLTMSDVTVAVGAKNYLCEQHPVFDKDTKDENLGILKESLGEQDYQRLVKFTDKAREEALPILRRELPFKIPYHVWDEISCRGKGGCKCADTTKCGYKKKSEDIIVAPISVTNHNYLTKNKHLMKMSEKSDYSKFICVVDEAHKFPEVIANMASTDFCLSRLRKNIEDFLILTKEKEQDSLFSGVLETNSELKNKLVLISQKLEAMAERIKFVEQGILSIAGETKKNTISQKQEDLLKYGLSHPLMNSMFLLGALSKEELVRSGIDKKTLESEILRNLNKSTTLRIDIASLLREISDDLKSVIIQIKNQSSDKIENDEVSKKDLPKWAHDIYSMEKLCKILIKGVEGVFNVNNKTAHLDIFHDIIYWYEKGIKNISLMSAPIDHREIQSKEVHEVFKHALPIFTSATLGTETGGLYHFKKELGLQKKPCVEAQIPSDFHWKDDVLLVIPNDVPLPSFNKDNSEVLSEDTKAYINSVCKSIADNIPFVDGNSMVLCSSIAMADAVSQHLEKKFKDDNIMVLNQANGYSIDRMIHRMKQGVVPKKVLVATQTMWQGVDLPGESLRGLFICKTPFTVPTHPLAVARKDVWHEKYKQPYFSDVSLPDALRMIRQGCGRIKRTKDDYGVVFCYDPNISQSVSEERQSLSKKKPYLKQIQRAFPENLWDYKHVSSLKEIPQTVKTFFENKKSEVSVIKSPSV